MSKLWPDPEYVKQWGIGPHYTSDALVVDEQERLLLIKRKVDGLWAMPGGFNKNKPAEIVTEIEALGELHEETGLALESGSSLVRVWRGFGNQKRRDPRAWMVTCAHLFRPSKSEIDRCEIKAADDAADYMWAELHQLDELDMYADHQSIIMELLEIAQLK